MDFLRCKNGPVCFCGSPRAAELNDSSWAPTVEWTSGSSFQRAAIIWTGLTGLLRGGLSKNTPYLCDLMMTLTSAAVSCSFNFSPIPFPLPRRASPPLSFWSRDKPFCRYPRLVLIRQHIQQHLSQKASFSAPFHTEVSVFFCQVSIRSTQRTSLMDAWRDFSSVHWNSWFEETNWWTKGFTKEWRESRREGRGRTGPRSTNIYMIDDLTQTLIFFWRLSKLWISIKNQLTENLKSVG